ncbi:hypothetical protein D9M72_286540 [compost metagenome]
MRPPEVLRTTPAAAAPPPVPSMNTPLPPLPVALKVPPVLCTVAPPTVDSTAISFAPLRVMLPAFLRVAPWSSVSALPIEMPASTCSVAARPALLSTMTAPVPSAPLPAAISVPSLMAVPPV